MKTQQLLGISFTNATQDEVIEYLFTTLIPGKKKAYIVTPNPEIVVYASKHPSFRNIINQAQLSLPDGVGITLGARWLGKPFSQRITGVDFMLRVCKESVKRPVKIGLLGAGPGVAVATAERLRFLCPGIEIVFVEQEWPSSFGGSIDLLFVAFGHPKQEEWIADNLERLPVHIAMGVGGAFDYLAGDVARAPRIMQEMGLEWLFRLVREPWRWKRQLSLLEFVYLLIQAKFGLQTQ